MTRVTSLVAIPFAMLAPVAGAQGINLALDDCGVGGTLNAPANCTSNTGIAMSMVGSVVPPAGMDRVIAMDAYIDGWDHSERTLSPWWRLDGCRVGALALSFDFLQGPFNCNDFWSGLAYGGGGISPQHNSPNHFQIKLTCATVAENPMDPNLEHYVFRVNILRARSTGTGACAGCTDQVRLVLNRINIGQPAGVGDATLTTPIVGNSVTYNCPWGCDWVPARNRTWGQVKAQYR